MRNIAIILAGGSGKRIGGDIPKQFWNIAGKTILEHTLEKFERHHGIDEITLVVQSDQIEHTHHLIQTSGYQKIRHIIQGGKERYHSTLSALGLYKDMDVNLLIHDAARPLVSERIITDVIEALAVYRAVNVAIPATDTIVETDPTHTFMMHIPNRDLLYQVQTPQGFRAGTLFSAYQQALKDPDFRTTDDCGVVMKYLPGEKIKIVKGETTNIKFTYIEDRPLLEHLLKK